MPIRQSTNNQILPANARATDVARKAVNEVNAVQQVRTMAAFRVQGYPGILYTRLLQGRKCSCTASQGHMNTRLDAKGKAKPGFVNELLAGMTFDVTPYSNETRQGTSPSAPVSIYQGSFETAIDDSQFTELGHEGLDVGDNGPIDLEALVTGFDASTMGITDIHCNVCFGTSFIGGYTPFNGARMVFAVTDVELGLGSIDYTKYPWVACSQGFKLTTVLPKGAIGLDSIKIYNNHIPITAEFKIDDQAVTLQTLLKKCDGKEHHIEAIFDASWTHFELQFVLSTESAFFEFPKLNKGSDTTKLEQLDPFGILVGPNIPALHVQDIIVESVFGKSLIVETSSWHNDRNRHVLGWECQVRVLQPQEILNNLPKRGRVMSKSKTTQFARDNQTGPYRT